MLRNKYLKVGLLVAACVVVAAVVFGGIYSFSFYWPWLDVKLRASRDLSDVYDRCTAIRLGQSLNVVMEAMHGLDTMDQLSGDRSISFYHQSHSADLCRVQFTVQDPPRVSRVEFLVD